MSWATTRRWALGDPRGEQSVSRELIVCFCATKNPLYEARRQPPIRGRRAHGPRGGQATGTPGTPTDTPLPPQGAPPHAESAPRRPPRNAPDGDHRHARHPPRRPPRHPPHGSRRHARHPMRKITSAHPHDTRTPRHASPRRCPHQSRETKHENKPGHIEGEKKRHSTAYMNKNVTMKKRYECLLRRSWSSTLGISRQLHESVLCDETPTATACSLARARPHLWSACGTDGVEGAQRKSAARKTEH